MTNMLIVTGHTHPETSVANKAMIEELQREFPNAQIDNLTELYPDFQIDVEAERNKMLWADVIVIQAPVFWYSLPSMINRWIEETFTHGWAYGSTGHALDGKRAIVAMTAGADEEAYADGGIMGITAEEIAKPYETSFTYCRVNYLGTVFTGGMINMGEPSEERKAFVHKMAVDHVHRMKQLLEEE